MTVIAAIGTAYGGDDSVGLVVAERIRALGLSVTTVPDASALVAVLAVQERIVVVDAVVGRGAPGEVLHLAGTEIMSIPRGGAVSSHGIGLGEAIALTRALDEAHAQDVHLVGIVILPPSAPGTSLSAPVAAAVEPAVALACRLGA
jgi:hydrogenase maturation protease